MALDPQLEALVTQLHANPDDEALLAEIRKRLIETGQRKTLARLLIWKAGKSASPEQSAALHIEAAGLMKEAQEPLAKIEAVYAKIDNVSVGGRWRALGLHGRSIAILELGGDRNHAIQYLERAVSLDPDLDPALSLLAQLLESAPNPSVRTRAANIYTRLGEKGGGEPYFRRALSIHPTSEVALAHLEVAFMSQGKPDELVRYWERFVDALDRKAGTASERAETHVRCQLATHLVQAGKATEARRVLSPVQDADTPSVVALLSELEAKAVAPRDASRVAFLAALEDAEESEITSEDVAVQLSNPPPIRPPQWEPDFKLPDFGSKTDIQIPKNQSAPSQAKIPATTAAGASRSKPSVESEQTQATSRAAGTASSRPRRAAPEPTFQQSAEPVAPRASQPPAEPSPAAETYTGWAPPDGAAPVIERDPDDEVFWDQRALSRLFPSEEAAQRAPKREASTGHAVEVVRMRDDTVLSEQLVTKRYVHPDLSVRYTSEGATVSLVRGFKTAKYASNGRTIVVTPDTTDVHLKYGDRLDALIGTSQYTVSVRPKTVLPSAGAAIPWKKHSYSLAASFATHLSLLLAFAMLVLLGGAPPVVDTRSQEEIFAEAKLKPPPPAKPKPKPRPRPVRLTKKKVPKPAPDRQVKIPKSLRKTLRKISKQRDRKSKDTAERAVSALRTPLAGDAQSLSEAVTNLDAVKGGEKSGAFRVGGTLAALDSKGVNIAGGGGGDIGTLRAGSATKNIGKLSKRSGKTRGRVSSIAALSKVQGSLSRGEVTAVINRNIGKIQRCYEQGLARRDSLSGRVQVKWVISTSGRVSSAKQAGSTLGDRKVEQCVIKVVKRMKFPKPSGGSVQVSYPFVFQRSG